MVNIPILYEDNHLLVVEKPINIPVQEDASKDIDLLTILKDDIKKRYNKPGNVFLALVHRLDRPVGGVIIFAKTSKAASRLSEQFRTNKVEKRYLTIVRGTPENSADVLVDYLLKNNKQNKVSVVSKHVKQAKKAILDYERLETNDQLSLLKVTLHTGRPHQIRVQLSSRGLPIFGDQKYGQNVNKIGQQIALWSYEMTFKHPTKDEELTIKSLPPDKHPWSLFNIF